MSTLDHAVSSGQATFTAALFDPDRPPPAGLVAHNGSDPERRFAVYRNNVIVSLVNALKAIFPITAELVGADFFAAMAAEHVRVSPPRSRRLAVYGADFPAFIRGFTPANGVPYLADVAAFEAARLAVYHAADEEALAPDAIAARLGDDLAAARFRLVDAHRVSASPYALFSLFAAHRGDLAIETVNPFEPEAVLITRVGDDVLTTRLSPADAAFLGALGNGETLGDAAAAALAVDPDLSLPHMLAALFGAGLITDVLTP
jgi:hypothetical protein